MMNNCADENDNTSEPKMTKICGMIPQNTYLDFKHIAATRHNWTKGYTQKSLNEVIKLFNHIYSLPLDKRKEILTLLSDYK